MRKCFFISAIIILLTNCKSVSYTDKFVPDDLKLSLTLYKNADGLNGKIVCKNISCKKLAIPKFYLSFISPDYYLLKSNWLSIKNENNVSLKYRGNYFDPTVKSLKSDVLMLRPNETYEICIPGIDKNYDLSFSKKLTVSYLGPLGESDVVEYLLE